MLEIAEGKLTFGVMNDHDLLKEVKAKAQAWTQAPHDEHTQRTVRTWLDTCDQDDDAREALICLLYTSPSPRD